MRRFSVAALLAVMFWGLNPACCETAGQIHNVDLPEATAKTAGFATRVWKPAGPSYNNTVVAIYYKKADGNTYLCTGVLITTQVVLTAGHCGCGLPGSYWINTDQDARNTNPAKLSVVAGLPALYDQRVCRNGYLGDGNDLALIRLRDEIILESNPNSSSAPSQGYPPDLVINLRRQIAKGSRLTVIGYGYTESRQIGMRNEGEVSVYSFDCEERALQGFCSPFSEMILADQTAGRSPNDTCGGDSGGPVYWNQNGNRRLVAITSRAAPGTQANAALHCGGGGIYTLIGRKTVHDWLEANGVKPIAIQGGQSQLDFNTPRNPAGDDLDCVFKCTGQANAESCLLRCTGRSKN